MSTIPTSVTEKQFEDYIRPHLRTAQRGYTSKIALYKIFNYILYRLHTGCQWAQLPIQQGEISWQSVYYHFRKWSSDGSLARVWTGSIKGIQGQLQLQQLNLDGSHVVAKKGGEGVAYQGRKRAKTSNILPITDGNGYILATSGILAGNHHDAFELKPHLRAAFTFLQALGFNLRGVFFNADSAFDNQSMRLVCRQYGLLPNVPENKRNRKTPKRGPKHRFNAQVYRQRFVAERTFAWVDKFRALLLRFDRTASAFLGAHYLAFAMINLRHLLAQFV